MIDRRFLFLMVGSMLLVPMVSLQAQFVTLEGKDFKLEGEDFYPIIENFSVLYVHHNPLDSLLEADDIYYSMEGSWGNSSAYDCAGPITCRDELYSAFQKVDEMGFNAIRLVGNTPGTYAHMVSLGPDEIRFIMEVSFVNTDSSAKGRFAMEAPAYEDPFSMRHFAIIREVLDVADEAGLKVILLTGESSDRDTTTTPVTTNMYTAFDQRAVDDYSIYLARMAEEFSAHPALLAFDLCNEPHFRHMERQGFDGILPDDELWWTK